MREVIEFRIPESHTEGWLSENDGEHLGIARKLELEASDPRLLIVAAAEKHFKKRNSVFSTCAIYHRYYSAEELRAAALFNLQVASMFEPAGEERGTKYDELAACPKCGAGAVQLTPLFLSEKSIPKKDVCRTIAGEIIVSRRVKELFARHQITGATLGPVCFSQKSSAVSPDWFQLTAVAFAEVVLPSRIGIDPFDDDEAGEYRCGNNDTAGLRLLSELSVRGKDCAKTDIFSTRQYFGYRRGLLRPERVILISPRLHTLLKSEKIKGFKVEVAHIA